MGSLIACIVLIAISLVVLLVSKRKPMPESLPESCYDLMYYDSAKGTYQIVEFNLNQESICAYTKN